MKTLKYLALLCGAITLAGCASNRGGAYDTYDTQSGAAMGGTAPEYVPPQQIDVYPPNVNSVPSVAPP